MSSKYFAVRFVISRSYLDLTRASPALSIFTRPHDTFKMKAVRGITLESYEV
jgi:hypothetical protein